MFQLLLKAGGEGKHTVFLFSDSQIKDESFMEDISMILNTGDVPNLYAADEKAEVIEKMQGMARKEVSLLYDTIVFMLGFHVLGCTQKDSRKHYFFLLALLFLFSSYLLIPLILI